MINSSKGNIENIYYRLNIPKKYKDEYAKIFNKEKDLNELFKLGHKKIVSSVNQKIKELTNIKNIKSYSSNAEEELERYFEYLIDDINDNLTEYVKSIKEYENNRSIDDPLIEIMLKSKEYYFIEKDLSDKLFKKMGIT